jgi:hypothetical protein
MYTYLDVKWNDNISLARSVVYGKDDIRIGLKNTVGRCGRNFFGSGQRPVAGFCKHGKMGMVFLDHLSDF